MMMADYTDDEAAYILYLLNNGVAHPQHPHICYACHTTDTPLWRKGLKMSDGSIKQMCNACAIRESRQRQNKRLKVEY